MSLSDKNNPLQLFDDLIYYYKEEDLKQAIKDLREKLPFKRTQFTKQTIKIIEEVFGDRLFAKSQKSEVRNGN